MGGVGRGEEQKTTGDGMGGEGDEEADEANGGKQGTSSDGEEEVEEENLGNRSITETGEGEEEAVEGWEIREEGV